MFSFTSLNTKYSSIHSHTDLLVNLETHEDILGVIFKNQIVLSFPIKWEIFDTKIRI